MQTKVCGLTPKSKKDVGRGELLVIRVALVSSAGINAQGAGGVGALGKMGTLGKMGIVGITHSTQSTHNTHSTHKYP